MESTEDTKIVIPQAKNVNLKDVKARMKKNVFLTRMGKFLAHRVGIWTGTDYISIAYRSVYAKGLKKLYLQVLQQRIGSRLGIEMDGFEMIGEGLTLAHAHGIIVNSRVRIGKNCVLYQGVTLGSIRGGKKEGVPVLEDHIVVCANATVVGGVRIGHDTLIASNSFVDFDVPSHSVVRGNPAVIYHKENASRDYLN